MRPNSIKLFLTQFVLVGAVLAQAEVISIISPASGDTVDTGGDITVSFTIAAYFTVGDSGCTDCDGFIRAFLSGETVATLNATVDFTIVDLFNGDYMLTLEAVNPNGDSFDPVIQDTASFTVIGNLRLCPPRDLSVVAGDARNFLYWDTPVAQQPGEWIYFHDGTFENSFSSGAGMAGLAQLFVPVSYPATIQSVRFFVGSFGSWSADIEVNIFHSDGVTLLSGPYTVPGVADDWIEIDIEDAIINDGGFLVATYNVAPGGPYIGVDNSSYNADLYFGNIDGWTELGEFGYQYVGSHEALIYASGRSIVYNNSIIVENINYNSDQNIQYSVSPGSDYSINAGFNTNTNSSRAIIEGCGDFQNYSVYTSDGTVVATIDTNFYFHENLTNGTEYCYYIVANYTEGSSNATATECATPEVFNPLPVTNLSATPLDEEVALSWTDPNTPSYTYYSSFEGSDDGFSADGDFERGTPLSGPDGAASGSECFGTNLSGPYSNNSISFLTSPSYSLAGLVNPVMQISQWYYIEGFYDGGNVKISGDEGMTWSILTPVDDYPEDAVSTANANIPGEPAFSGTTGGDNWHTVQFDLSSYADSTVMFRFDFGSDGSVTYDGWFIDDFAIFDNPTGREVDGDLLGYNIYLDGVMIMDSVEATGYLVTGLTNTTTYTFGVSASYFPTYESDIVNVSATPTWLYGDLIGTITDPNGNVLDSAVVYSGDVVDTTSTDGTYLLHNLLPGTNLITVKRDGFENLEENVTVLAQEDAVIADFELTPKLDAPVDLIASGDNSTVHLIWRKPSSSLAGDLTGTWDLFFDWFCTGVPSLVMVEFTEDGLMFIGGILSGNWYGEEGEVELGDGLCTAVNFEYNAYFTFNDFATTYYMAVDDDVFSGVITEGSGLHDGDNNGVRIDDARTGPHPTSNTMDATTMLDLEILDLVFNPGLQNNPVVKQRIAAQLQHTSDPTYISVRNMRTLSRTLEDSLIGYSIYQVMDTGDSLVATNNDPDDTTATISVAGNYTEYCFNVRAIWNTDEYGILESKASDDACAIPFRPGDVDFNDIVDIADLLTVVNFVLGVDLPTDAEFNNADVYRDGQLNISDVVLIVDIIFGDQNARYTEQPDVPVQAALLRADRQLLVNMDYPGVTRGIQFTLSVGAGLELGPVQTAVDVAGIMAVSRQNAAGELIVVVFNNAGGTVEQDGSTVIRIPFQFKGGGQDKATVELTDFQVAGMLGEVLPVTIGEKRVEISILPDVFALHQNYPNPFNPVTEIRIDVPETSPVTLTIYNIMGQEVTTVLDGQLDGGIHRVRWNGTNNLGETVGTGVYFYRLSAPTFTSTKKMIMMK